MTKKTTYAHRYIRLSWLALALSLMAPYHCFADESSNEYTEMDLRIMPGFETVSSGPTAFKSSMSAGGQITYFLKPWYAMNVFYQYTNFDPSSLQRAGGGPLFRVLDLAYFRTELEAHASYVRALGKNHAGWGLSSYFSFPFRSLSWIPFVGPFVSFDQTYLDGKDLKTLSFGLMLSITGKSDLD